MIARAMMAGKPWDAFDAGMDADACFVHPHHPDRLGIPEPRPGRVRADRMRSALAWNVFRTLAPIDPSRWLRPLHARVFGFDQRYVAPQWLDVRVWAAVPAAGGAGAAGCVDVLCTSGDAVWAFLTTFERDVIVTAAAALLRRAAVLGHAERGHRRAAGPPLCRGAGPATRPPAVGPRGRGHRRPRSRHLGHLRDGVGRLRGLTRDRRSRAGIGAAMPALAFELRHRARRPHRVTGRSDRPPG